MTGVRRIALFAGTTEGRILAAGLSCGPVAADVFVATEYGKKGLPEAENIRIFAGRMDEAAIFTRLLENSYDLVADATHPFAREVSENIRNACERAGVPRIRVLRDRTGERDMGTVFVETVAEAVEFLKTTEGPVFVTTGSKELYRYKELPGWEERVYARVLSLPQVVEECGRLGFLGSHLIAMQGPFSVELNAAMLQAAGARWMVTKEAGAAGGFEEKEEAARRAGVRVIAVGRPKEAGISLKEAQKLLGIPEKRRKVFLVGAGPGGIRYLTGEARQAFLECQVIAGAGRVLSPLSVFHKPFFPEYRPEKILAYLKEHPEYRTAAVALSGDTGFFSGAKKLLEAFQADGTFDTAVVPGLSSAGYFFSRTGKSWDDVEFLSLHGRDGDLEKTVEENEKVFLLCGGKDSLKEICGRLLGAGLSGVSLTVGEDLSLPGEKICDGTPESLKDREVSGLTVVFVENPAAGRPRDAVPAPAPVPLTHGLPDEAFLRGKTPMTKMEVRAVSLSKLELQADSVVFDVGAGTGSVSVECARLSDRIRVFSIERNPEAAALLLKNREKFGLSNMEIVRDSSPEGLEALPAPTHVFVGGGGTGAFRIVECVLKKNRTARFVFNIITPETLAAVLGAAKSLPVTEPEIVMVTAARSKAAGKSHLMMGLNPVFIVTFSGKEED